MKTYTFHCHTGAVHDVHAVSEREARLWLRRFYALGGRLTHVDGKQVAS